MSNFDIAMDCYQRADNPLESKLPAEVIGGAAAFGGLLLFEKHVRPNCKTLPHEYAREVVASYAMEEANRLFEAKGDNTEEDGKSTVNKIAVEQAKELYDNHYANIECYDPSRTPAPDFYC